MKLAEQLVEQVVGLLHVLQSMQTRLWLKV